MMSDRRMRGRSDGRTNKSVAVIRLNETCTYIQTNEQWTRKATPQFIAGMKRKLYVRCFFRFKQRIHIHKCITKR